MRHHWFIGDIHGCFEALQRLEDRIRRASDRKGAEAFIVSVGDLIDRGPDSAAVVAHFRDGAAAGTHAAILGNHEEMMLRCLRPVIPEAWERVGGSKWVVPDDELRKGSPRASWLTEAESNELGRLMWLVQGGSPSLASWGIDPHRLDTWAELPDEDLAFLCGLPLVFECDAAVATHALVDAAELKRVLRPGDVVDPATREAARQAMWRRSLPRGAPDRRTHVSGHTPLSRVRRYASRRLVRIDTGCYLGRRLSAWCAELDEVVSVAGTPVL